MEALAKPWSIQPGYGIPNLERYIELHPELYVQAVAWAYKRNDEGTDPPAIKADPENVERSATMAYKLLDGLERMPGHNDLGELELGRLKQWIDTVRNSCTELGREDIGDYCIGKLLSSAPVGKDGIWPCNEVRDVLEVTHSQRVIEGVHTGLYNSRGVHWRGEGGGQERELADKYRKWADALQFTHPYVSSKILMEMVRTYEREAERQDTEVDIRRRLH